MVPEQIRHEAVAVAGGLHADGRTPAAGKLAHAMLNASADLGVNNAEGVYACAAFLSTCLDGLSVEQQMVLLAGAGNIAMSLHMQEQAAQAALAAVTAAIPEDVPH